MTGSNVLAAETGCTSPVLHTVRNSSTTVVSYCEKKKTVADEDLEDFVNWNLVN